MTEVASPSARHADPRVDRLIRVFEALSPADLERWDEIYIEAVDFKDPFNEVHRLEDVRRIFDHMFQALEAPRFVVHTAVAEADQCFLTWDFHFGIRGKACTIRGSSHLIFAADGRVCFHRDYWDAAEELYEKLPLLGGLMRWLRRRLAS